ncbi:NADPH-dependent F420 reductase [Comamonas phosphati]|nr:NADPH-dependent F420 reductase [Comamonas phosphati]
MKILVIGTGNMGAGFVKQLAAAGHQVAVTARDIAKAEAIAGQYNAKAVPVAGAAREQDAIVVAVPSAEAVGALRSVGDIDGKVVIDITNPLTADYLGLTVGHSTSASEQIAQALPGAEVVKGFNTVFAQVLAAGANFGGGQKVTVFPASDSERAKQTARTLAESMGFQTMDAGGLKNARYLEPLAGLNIYFGYGAGLGTDIAPTWIHRA